MSAPRVTATGRVVPPLWLIALQVVALAVIVGMLLSLAGCENRPRAPVMNPTPTLDPDTATGMVPAENERFRVVQAGIFVDTLSYNDRRGIYVITDKQTGQEYIGISGIGISEVGTHSVRGGKTTQTREDER